MQVRFYEDTLISTRTEIILQLFGLNKVPGNVQNEILHYKHRM